MNLTQIESKLKVLVKSVDPNAFIYDLLSAYNLPKASITRLQKGNLNLSKKDGEIIWKKKLHFRFEDVHDLHSTITEIEKNHKHNERFLIVTDYRTILSIDTRTGDRLDCEITDLPKHYDFFLPWAGMEKTKHANENPADVKAAEKMARLFDAIKQNNPDDSPDFIHGLNIFLSRLLFCYFAEDTNIFSENQFTNAIGSHTQADGSDLDAYLFQLFEILDTPKNQRVDIPEYLNVFPYVNGGLFKDKLNVPKLDRKVRQSIIDGGTLNWSDINPDIFGSMFQAVINVDQRGSLGQHYTSVPNIMKVIEPLFLNDLKEEFERSKGNKKKLTDLLQRLSNIKIFDPACGSGNFLIIAYKELRRLEIQILHQLQGIHETVGMGSLDFGSDYLSHISLNNFYGIEIDDFAHEIAKLALWLAEHQMNQEFFKAIGKSNPTLPLKDAGQIVNGNSSTISWFDVCPNSSSEVYILGNPPYLGARNQSPEQKKEMQHALGFMTGVNSLDYIGIWFYKGAEFISTVTKGGCSFVSTNSISQGQQVAILWPSIFNLGIEIDFAHQAFKWKNNARSNAGVTVVIIGLKKRNTIKKKIIFSGSLIKEVDNISPYLTAGSNLFVTKRNKPLISIPPLVFGNQAIEGGYLTLSPEEKNKLLEEHPNSNKYLRRLYGADEFLYNKERWCIWVNEEELEDAEKIDSLKRRFTKVREFRESGGQVARSLVSIPYRFRYIHEAKKSLLIIPRTTSENREYLPVGYADEKSIVTDAVQVIYDAQPYIMAVLSSRMHLLWVKAVGGGLETRIRYSNQLCYNTFPFPKITPSKIEELTKSTLRIIEVRETYSERPLAELYDPKRMPHELLEAHQNNDKTIELFYRVTPFSNDEERLEYLFKLYEKMTLEEQSASTLFEKQKKSRKKK